MDAKPAFNTQSSLPFSQIKESTRDMVNLQSNYQLSDELFWEAFNKRVLLNVPLDLSLYASLLMRR